MKKRLFRWLIVTVIFGGVFFGVAGRWDLPALWIYVGGLSALLLVGTFTVDPELSKERRRPGPSADPGTLVLLRLTAVAHYAVALLDVGRFHWSDRVPLVVQAAAFIVLWVSFALVIWAMSANRFFSPAVRIQRERGHHVVTTGPYAYVRHPGYAAMFLALPASALALRSWWALLPAVLFSLVVLRRAAIEDPYLQEHLEGYQEYARHVRYRLVPRVW